MNLFKQLLILSQLFSLLSSQAINSQRSPTFNNVCQNFQRSLLSETSSFFPFDYSPNLNLDFSKSNSTIITSFINSAISIAGFSDSAYQPIGNHFIASVAISGIIVLICPFLLCYCGCHKRCVPKRCREKRQFFSKCERYWPSILVICFSVPLLALGIGISLQATQVFSMFERTGCSWSVLLDDLMNGKTSGSSLFSGFSVLREQFQILSNSLDGVVSEMQALQINQTSIEYSLIVIQADTSRSLNGSLRGNVAGFTYNSPFDLDIGTTTINSIMPNYAGAYETSGQMLLVSDQFSGNTMNAAFFLYENHNYTFLDEIRTFINEQNNFTSNLTSFIQTLQVLEEEVSKRDDEFYDYVVSLSSYFSIVYLFLMIGGSLIVGLSLPLIIGVVCLTCFDKPNSRYLIYAICGFSFIAFIFLAFGCITVGIMIPTIKAHSQNYGLNNNLQYYLGSELYGYLKPAYENPEPYEIENNYFVDYLMDQICESATTSIVSLKLSLYRANLFDPDQFTYDQWDTLYDTLNDYYYGKIFDFDSTADQAIIEDLSDPGNFNCTSGTFQNDSWIPTISSPVSIECKVSGNSVDSSQCSSVSIVQTSSNGCTGCIDSQSVLQVISSDLNTKLQTRYPSSDCVEWIDAIQNLWDNFYSIKENNYNSGLISRLNTNDASIQTFKTDLTAARNSFTQIFQNIEALTSNKVTNPESTVLDGWSSKPISEDMEIFSQILSDTYPQVQLLWILLICEIVLIGLMMTFTALAGLRHAKSNQMGERQLIPKNEMKLYIDVKLF